LVNIDSKKENKVEIDLKELGIGKFTGSILTSAKVEDHNTFNNPNNIVPAVFKNFKVKKNTVEITIPPFSVIVLEGK
jgi:alpha-N-arabinofuranosidase